MNTQTFTLSLIEISISILFGVIILYLCYRFLDKLLKEKLKIKNDNISYSIFVSSILFSVAYLIEGIKSPILNSLKLLIDNPEYEGIIILDGLKYSILFITIIVITILVVIFLSIFLFTIMTKDIDEFKEIKNNNIAIAIITATLIISISLLLKESVYLLLESFVPYPEIPRIF
jgi:uncharacterized membrane protein YjfL (UPF0719 family)|tara:strand:+ start:2957 stop:3478 length:522 start_codon:yes stop_codon:yes gene_type:complete